MLVTLQNNLGPAPGPPPLNRANGVAYSKVVLFGTTTHNDRLLERGPNHLLSLLVPVAETIAATEDFLINYTF